MPYCPNCGNEILTEVSFCPKCGARLNNVSEANASTPSQDESKVSANMAPQNSTQENVPVGKRRRKIIIPALAAIFVAAVGLIAGFGITHVLNADNESAGESVQPSASAASADDAMNGSASAMQNVPDPHNGCYVPVRIYGYTLNEDGTSYQDRVITFDLDEHGNMLRQTGVSTHGDSAGETTGVGEYIRDERGYPVLQKSIPYSDGEPQDVFYSETEWVYEYNDDGLPRSMKSVHHSNAGTTESGTTYLEYEDGRRIRTASRDNSGWTEYNEWGLIQESTNKYVVDGSDLVLSYKPDYSFNDEGRPQGVILKSETGNYEFEFGFDYGTENMVSAVRLVCMEAYEGEEHVSFSPNSVTYQIEYRWIPHPSPAVIANWSICPDFGESGISYWTNSIMRRIDFQIITDLDFYLFLEEQGRSLDSGSSPYRDGIYTGLGEGKAGIIEVTLSIKDGQITVDKIADPGETPGIGGAEAIEDGTFKDQIEDKQSALIDGVVGATLTSDGVRAAVEDALQQAADAANDYQ